MPNITLNSTILLPADMYWSNEFNYSPMSAKVATGLTGAPIIQYGQKKTGPRPIVLESGRDTALLTRAQLELLEGLSNVFPPEPFDLELADGRTFSVTFDYTSENPISVGASVQPGKVPAPDDLFTVTLRFMEIPA